MQLAAGAGERRVGHLRIRRRGGRPAQREAVEAVEDRREVDLAGRDAELGDVGYPDPVRGFGAEVVLSSLVHEQVGGRLGHLAFVEAVPAPPLFGVRAARPPSATMALTVRSPMRAPDPALTCFQMRL